MTERQSVPRLPLTATEVVALAAIVSGAQRFARVSRDLGDVVVTGTARHLVTDEETAAFPDYRRDDVRDCLLRVTLSTGFEAFWPVSELVVDYAAAMFVIHED